MSLVFRPLKADEIECRVGTITENGLSLLLYKDARVDQRMLDETVGPYNWQRSHSRENANCTVSIWDAEKQQWISKEDTGTESNTEKEKGLASDSFKRACFNFGIGRELYSAPFIWIKAADCTIKPGRNGKPACNDKFVVEKIKYTEPDPAKGISVYERNIEAIAIRNETTKKRVFVWNPNAGK